MRGRVEAWKVELRREASSLPVRAFGSVGWFVRRVMSRLLYFGRLWGLDGGEVVRVCVMDWMDGAMAIWSMEVKGKLAGEVVLLESVRKSRQDK